MHELAVLLGNGRYTFYKSLANSSSQMYRDIYSVAQSKINNISVQLSGRTINDTVANLDSMQQFQDRIEIYLNQLQSLATYFRNNEIAYIDDIANQFEKDKKDKLLSPSEKETLQNLKNQQWVSAKDYNNLIIALNKVTHLNDKNSFSENIEKQIKNISLAKTNLSQAMDKEAIEAHYIESYGIYTRMDNQKITHHNNVTFKLNDQIINTTVKQQRVELDKIAQHINASLNNLSNNQELINLIKQEYVKYANDTEFTIVKNQFLSYIIDEIINEIKQHPRQYASTTAKHIAQNIIQSLSSDKTLRDLASNSQSYKVTFQKKTKNYEEKLFKALAQGKTSAVNILLQMDDTRELILALFPEEGNNYIRELNDIQQKIDKLISKSDTALNKQKNQLNTKMKTTFRNSELGKMILKALTDNSDNFDLNTILQNQTDQFLANIKTQLSDLAVIVKKSSLAELMGSQRVKTDLAETIFNDIGGSFNLKDDVYFAIRTATIKAPSEAEISRDLQETINQINTTINETVGQFWEQYYNRDENSKYNDRAGAANTKKARADYENAMKELLDRLTILYNKLNIDTKKQLDKYAKNTNTFLGSISVKEYSLYQDTLGFHGGTLGSTAQVAIENIQAMYEQGGISTLDLETLMIALLNCSSAAIGGDSLRISLEAYLLGGAALMMFDAGCGEAIPYLDKMPNTIKNLMPKNLNLYQLNGAYIPASYVLYTIYENLNEFYHNEYMNSVGDFVGKNRVTISNVPQISYTGEDDVSLITQFQTVSEQVLEATHIQFMFMAGMLDIFSNLSKVFKVQK